MTNRDTQAGAEPTEPGWYWAELKEPYADKAPTQVIADFGGRLIVCAGDGAVRPVSAFWWGPRIPEPGAALTEPLDAMDAARWRRLVMLLANSDTEIAEADDVLAVMRGITEMLRVNGERMREAKKDAESAIHQRDLLVKLVQRAMCEAAESEPPDVQ